MPIHDADFGRDLIPLHGNDMFFLDTNVVIAYLFERDRYHRACLMFLRYLLSKQVILCLTEVVIAEAINGLARLFYTYDQLQASGGHPNHHRSIWSRHVIKNDHALLTQYNQMACERLAPLLDLCLIVESSEEHIQLGMQFCTEYPLASADALIVSSACINHASGLLSLDRDMRNVRDIEIYTTQVDNSHYEIHSMITKFGIPFQNYLMKNIGAAEYAALLSHVF